jgi:ribosomal protein S18 acetylase RimI-like enzyme
MSNRHPAKLPFHSRIVPGILRRLERIGILVQPFLVVSGGEQPLDVDLSRRDYDFGFLTEADIDALLRLESDPPRETLEDWFRRGRLCFGVKDGPRVVAKMWCDPETFNFPPNFRELAEDEVYLFAAYADPAYRGRNLAPMMRYACCKSLGTMGKTRFWSYTDYYNVPARIYKAKLGARDEALRLHLSLFGRWSGTFTLRRY